MQLLGANKESELTAVLKKKRLELLAPINEVLHRASLDLETEVEGEALEVDTVVGKHLDMRVVDETDAVQVDGSQVWGMGFDLADVDHLVDLLLLFVTQLERTWRFSTTAVINTHICIQVRQ